MHLTHWLETLVRDARVGVRGFRRSPSFVVIAIAILALGIGMTTAMSSVYHAVLLRALPVVDQDHIILPRAFDRAGVEYAVWPEDLAAFRKTTKTLRGVAGVVHWGATETPFVDGGRSIVLGRALVTGNFFDVLGARPVLGRLLRPEDDVAGAAHAIVLSYGAWQRVFHGDSSVIGKRLVGAYFNWDYPIVGVAAPGLDYPAGADYWLATAPLGRALMSMVGRLQASATPAAAAAELATWHRTIGDAAKEHVEIVRTDAPTFARIVLGDVTPLLNALAAAVALLLVIACFNVGNLLLVRGAARSHELSIRRAIGASHAAIVQQLLIEGGMLGLAGGAVGLLAARAVVGQLLRLAPTQLPRIDVVGVDGVSALTAIGVSIAAVLLFGLAPAFSAARGSLALTLRLDGRSGNGTHRRRVARQWLVASQIALAMILLAGAGLLARSLDRLRHLDLGYQPAHLALLQITMPQADDPGSAAGRARFFAHGQQALDRLRAVHGVVSATPVLLATPFRGTDTFVIKFHPVDDASIDEFVPWEDGDRDYFRTLGTQIVRGRGFLDTDVESSQAVVVVSEGLARHFWKDADPIGKRIMIGTDTSSALTVVGVARDIRFRNLRQPTRTLFRPWRQSWWQGAFAVRTDADLATIAPSLRRAVHEVDPQIAMWGEQSMDALLAVPLAQPTYGAALLAALGLAALTLAALGLYGVMNAIVRERTRELGIRMALGATASEVRRGVLSAALRVAVSGAVVGLLVALIGGRALGTLLFEVSPADPVTLAAVALLLICTTMAAAFIPARRATRIDPAIALKSN